MRKPYTERRGETQIFGYINESGEKIPVRSFPAYFMDPIRSRLQLTHIQEEFCQIQEKITRKTPLEDVIRDFQDSDDPKFEGKSKEERRKMALGAYYGMHPELSRKDMKEGYGGNMKEGYGKAPMKEESDDEKPKGTKEPVEMNPAVEGDVSAVVKAIKAAKRK